MLSLIDEEEVLDELEKMSRERFQKIARKLVESIGFEVRSIRSFGGDFEAEAELPREGKILDYIIRITRSGGDPEKEIKGLEQLLAPGMKGLYISTREITKEAPPNIEAVGNQDFYNMLKEYDILEGLTIHKEESRALPSASETARIMKWGRDFFRKKNYPKAVEYFDKAITKKPEATTPRLWKAKALISMGEPHEAEAVLREAIKKDSTDPDIWVALGEALHELGLYEDEIEAYDSALDIDEDFVDAWKNKGATLYEQELYDEAELCFDRVLEVRPKDEGAWNNKGLCLFKKGELKEALNCINNALQLHPDYLEALINKALLLENQNKIAPALRVAEKLVNMQPENANFHYIKSAYLEALGEIELAYKSADKSVKLNPEYDRAKKLKTRLEKRIDRKKVVEKEKVPDTEREEDEEYLSKKIMKLENEISTLKKIDQKVPSVKKKKELEEGEGSEKLNKVIKERDELKKDLERKENKMKELLKLKSKVEERMEDELDLKEIDQIKKEKDELNQIKKKVKDDIDQLREKRDGLEEEIKELHSLKGDEDNVNRLLKEKEQAMKELEEKEGIIKDLKETKDQLLDDLARLKREEKKKKKEKEEAHEKIGEIRAKEESDKELKREALVRFQIGEYKSALSWLDKVQSPELLNIEGCCLYELGMIDEAEDIFLSADTIEAKLNLEEIYYSSGRYDKAVDISELLMEDLKDCLIFWERKGETMRKIKKHDEAQLCYLKAKEISSTHMPDLYLAESKSKVETSSIEEEIVRISMEIEEDGIPELKNLLASYMFMKNDYKRSFEIFREITEIPTKGVFHNNRGCSAYHLGRYGEALTELEKASEIENNSVYLTNLGFCQLQRNLVEAAENSFKMATKVDENDPVAWYNLGIAMKRLKKDGWKEYIKKSLELEPDFEAAQRLSKT